MKIAIIIAAVIAGLTGIVAFNTKAIADSVSEIDWYTVVGGYREDD